MKPSSALQKFLPYQLSITSNAVSGRIAMEYRSRFGLSVPEWRVMAVLGDSGAQTQRDLTRRTLMDKVAVNRACKVLEERGYASRTPNESDGRSHLLELTEEGRAIHDQVMPLAVDMERRIFDGFSEAELQEFRALLEKLMSQVEEFCDEDTHEGNYGVK